MTRHLPVKVARLCSMSLSVVPAVAALGGDAGVAGLAQCHEVAGLIAAAIGKGQDVVNLFGCDN